MKPYVNLGCGSRFHPDWVNIDLNSSHPQVIAHDLSKGIPLADSSCQVAYHSHVLEHIQPAGALFFLRECHRVLQPGGIIRVATPDLERMCRAYLACLEGALRGETSAIHGREWMVLEMLDQLVRERSGGEMAAYLQRKSIPNAAFIIERIGEEGRGLLEPAAPNAPEASPPMRPAGDRSKSRVFLSRIYRFPQRTLRAVRRRFKRLLTQLALDQRQKKALEIGLFRLSGQVHQWLYDRYSLSEILNESGFANPEPKEANQSAIPDWAAFHLEVTPEGRIIKPDSLFMEARKLQ